MNTNLIRRTTSLATSIALLAALATAAFTGPVAAGQPDLDACQGHVSGGEFRDVTVPKGGWCSLHGVTVSGSVTIKPGGRLDLYGSEVRRNVRGGKGTSIYVWASIDGTTPSVIGGHVRQHKGVTTQITSGSTVHGNVLVTKGDHSPHTHAFALWSATVKGNLHLKKNVAVRVRDSRIEGNCHMRHNTKWVDVQGNIIDGHRKGQCQA